MPPPVALLLTIGFIVYLFRREARHSPHASKALWLPFIWLLIISSRSVGQWLAVIGINALGSSMEEGSPLDALTFLVLIVMGLAVLVRRRVSLGEVVRNNRMLAVYFLFCFLSILWSDYPLSAFKRWTKILGHPVLALIVLTEPDPVEAVGVIMRRCAYVLFPMSITFIKYFLSIGRGFDDWGLSSCNGVTRNKNELGAICMLWSFFFFCSLLSLWKRKPSPERKQQLILIFGLLGMIGYCVAKAHCATALVCLAVGSIVAFFAGSKWVKPRYLGTYIVVTAAVVIVEESVFGLSSLVLEALGRNSTLTGRTLLWQELLQFPVNRLIGTGFESFWLGPRLDALWAAHWWHPTEAHNGYLETLLNMGILGVILLLALLFVAFRKAQAELARNVDFGRFKVGLVIAVTMYNWTEAAFKGLSPIWFLFLLIAIDYPSFQSTPGETFDESLEEPYMDTTVESAPL